MGIAAVLPITRQKFLQYFKGYLGFFCDIQSFLFTYSLIFRMSPTVFCGNVVGKHSLNARLSNTPV